MDKVLIVLIQMRDIFVMVLQPPQMEDNDTMRSFPLNPKKWKRKHG